MATIKLLIPFFLLHLTLLFFLSSSNQITTNKYGFSVELIRHYKYNPSSVSSPESFQSAVLPNTANHLMKLSIGTPPVPALAVVDTGSDLVWARCKPCVDCELGRHVPALDPRVSSTYEELPCGSALCAALDASACEKGRSCGYTYGYGDGASTAGVLATETFSFGSDDGGNSVSVPAIGFGCSHNTSTSIDGHQIGFVGLGGGPTSLISQLGPSIGWKFSYCLSPFNEASSKSVISFGDKAAISGPNVVSTPLVSRDDKTFYYVTLQSIIIKKREIVVPVTTGPGNIFLDSGTTVTLLYTDTFNKLADAVANVVKLPRTTDPGGTFACYNATSRNGFPAMTFRFAGGADLVLSPINTFTVPSPDGLVCLSMQATDGTAVYGNLVQQNFHVAYDLAGKKVSFEPTQRSKLG